MIFPFDLGQILNFFKGLTGNVNQSISNWFSSLAGQIASALEAGIAAVFSDLWTVIAGPLEIAAGALIIVIALGIAFRHDVAGLAVLAAK